MEFAAFLNVSRQFLIKEIEAGRLVHRMVGTHRRIAFEDLIAYARKMREKQVAALDRMAQNACKLGLECRMAGHTRYTALLDVCVLHRSRCAMRS